VRERDIDDGKSGESPIANSRFMPLANWPLNLFIKNKKIKKDKEKEACRIPARSRRNPVGYSQNYCLRSILGKKNQKRT
jgi:hypothetical protein